MANIISIDISNFINTSINTSPQGLANYTVNNLAIFTKETSIETIDTYAIYINPSTVAKDWGTESEVYKQASAIFSQSPSLRNGSGCLIVIKVGAEETLEEAILRTKDINGIFYTGILPAFDITSEMPNLSNAVQSLNKILFFSSNDKTLLDSGVFVNIKTAGSYKTKCLLHTIGTLQDARIFASAYASRLYATNFDVANSTLTMNLKDLATILPSSWEQTDLEKAKNKGIDIYGTINGISKVVSYKNIYYIDSIFNQIAFASRLEVAYFNILATTGTKIAQTEGGMSAIKKVLADICLLFVSNKYIAPGVWNSPDIIGNEADFKRNILENGYYIYSKPISQQSQPDREERKAPACQIAIKEAGAIHSGEIIININQ